MTLRSFLRYMRPKSDCRLMRSRVSRQASPGAMRRGMLFYTRCRSARASMSD